MAPEKLAHHKRLVQLPNRVTVLGPGLTLVRNHHHHHIFLLFLDQIPSLCHLLKATSTTSCSSSPAPRRKSANAANRTTRPNGAKQSELVVATDLHAVVSCKVCCCSMGDDTASEGGDQESEEETDSNPYPLEGKFVDEADRAE